MWIRPALLAALCLFAAASDAREVQVTILHQNDVHGHVRSFCYPDERKDELCNVGGAARRASLIKRLRAQSQVPVLLLDAGDTTTRGPLSTEYEARDTAAVMNGLGVELAVLGNNEFKLRDGADANDAVRAQADLLQLVRDSKFPWLGANVTTQDGALLDGVQPYLVRNVDGLRIAFVGLTAPRSRDYPQTRGWAFQDPVDAAAVWVPRARAEADVVIALTHIGIDDDRRLARSVTGIDAIVGGDSHTFLWQPAEETAPDGRVVPIVQAGEFGRVLGKFALTFSDAAGAWRLANYAGNLIPVAASLSRDPALAKLETKFAAPLDQRIGTMPPAGATRMARRHATGQLLAQIWRAASGADAGVQSDGYMYDNFRAGPVTRYDVRAVLPFHERVVVAALTGAELNKIAAMRGKAYVVLPSEPIDVARTYRVAMPTLTAQSLKLRGLVDVADDSRAVVEAQFKRVTMLH